MAWRSIQVTFVSTQSGYPSKPAQINHCFPKNYTYLSSQIILNSRLHHPRQVGFLCRCPLNPVLKIDPHRKLRNLQPHHGLQNILQFLHPQILSLMSNHMFLRTYSANFFFIVSKINQQNLRLVEVTKSCTQKDRAKS